MSSTVPRWTPRHTKAELNAVAVAAQKGDQEAMHKLMLMMRPYAVSVIKKIGGSYTTDQREDLEQTAYVGILEALKRFDPDAGTKFSTYAHYWIRHEVQEWLARNSGAIPLPRTAWQAAGKLVEATGRSDLQDHPNLDEVLVEVTVAGERKLAHIPNAAKIARARASAYEIPEDFAGRDSDNPEDIYIDSEEETMEAAALAHIDLLHTLEEEEWYDASIQFCEEWDLPPAIADNLVAAAKLRFGTL